jgi:hydrogenase maturation protein HypF
VASTSKAVGIRVYGLVQGVGFRPFLHRLAAKHGVRGWAINTNDSVRIHAEGNQGAVDEFAASISTDRPELARVERVEVSIVQKEGFSSFEIRESASDSSEVTRVSPDMAVCNDCLADMERQANRIDYPFTNCTNCGPRFSIIESLPYDRPKTTMASFEMCASCRGEYLNIEDRRYHAQPNACLECGPKYTLVSGDKQYEGMPSLLDKTAELIDAGRIVAIKGIGGFHLACDATNQDSVVELRNRKRREGKPFAVMCRDIATVRRIAALDADEERILTSPRRPIVLLRTAGTGEGGGQCAGKGANTAIAPAVSNGMDSIGVMVPYMPLHYLLFKHLSTSVLVLTSGNSADEPIAIDNEDAIERLSAIADAYLLTNRDIHNRNDDSVLFVSGGAPSFLRRSRGWAPDPIQLSFETEGIAACGAELKGSFCLGKGTSGIVSQHLGDLKNPATFDFYREAFGRFCDLFMFTPKLAVCDMHPDYLSTRFADDLGIPVRKVQHHYAHVASCIAENGVTDKVIGVAMDGTGYGDDGAIWGGEFLLCDLLSYERVAHLKYLPLPGGDASIREPWRMAVGALHSLYGNEIHRMDHPVLKLCSDSDLRLLVAALAGRINTPMTSSAGRLFDTVAALTGLVTHSGFEAEAPMRLEAAITPDTGAYPYAPGPEISMLPAIEAVLSDIADGVPTGAISARFHNTVVKAIVETASSIRNQSGVGTVALSGGVFQNRYLLERSVELLEQAGFSVITQTKVPANDGGISLGQLAVAAARA